MKIEEQVSYKSKSESKAHTIRHEDIIRDVQQLEDEAIKAEQLLNQSPEFKDDTRIPYRVRRLDEHSKIFKPFDLTIDQAKKWEDYEFVERFQKYFSSTMEVETDAKKYGRNLETKQQAPASIQLVQLAHNFNRFMMTQSEEKKVTRGQIDSLINLISDLGNIYFKLPKLFFPFPI